MHGRNRSAAQALRARIVLLCAEGMDNKDVAERLKVSEQTVSKWRGRFVAHGFEGLADAPRSGAPHSIPYERVETLLERTATLTPTEAAKWSTRRAGLEMGFSAVAVSRIWRGAGLQLRDTSGPLLNGRQWDEHDVGLIGLYLGPPLRSIVVAIFPDQDAPTSRESSRNCEPPTPGDLQARPCLRQGMQLMLVALELVTAELGYGRYRGSEFIRFMRNIEADVPPELEVHALVDSSEGDAPAVVRRWPAKQVRLHIHHAPSPTGGWCRPSACLHRLPTASPR